jgi:hypothetical protein
MIAGDGCCVATVAMAEQRYRASVMGLLMLGQRFRINWGNGIIEDFSSPNQCSSNGTWVDTACLAGLCLADVGAWPAVCCDAVAAACMNGGVQTEPGICLCACPNGWTGSQCTGRARHMILDLMLVGMTRRAWVLGASGWFRTLVSEKMAVNLGSVELDGVQMEGSVDATDAAGVSRHVFNAAEAGKGWNSGEEAGSLNLRDITNSAVGLKVRVRVLASSSDDLLRIKKIAVLLTLSQVPLQFILNFFNPGFYGFC